MWTFKFDSSRCIAQLKVATKFLHKEEQKHSSAGEAARKLVVEQLRINNISKALILVEKVLLEDRRVKGLCGLRSCCTTVEASLGSFSLEAYSRNAELDEALATIFQAANVWGVKEVQEVAASLKVKCGKSIARDKVNCQIADCFEVKLPSDHASKVDCLQRIAQQERLPSLTYEMLRQHGQSPQDNGSFSSADVGGGLQSPAPQTPPLSLCSISSAACSFEGSHRRAATHPTSSTPLPAAVPASVSYYPPMAAMGPWSLQVWPTPPTALNGVDAKPRESWSEIAPARARVEPTAPPQFHRPEVSWSDSAPARARVEPTPPPQFHRPEVSETSRNRPQQQIPDLGTARQYTLAQIQAFTSNWKHQIGKGGFGDVFYGQLEDGCHVAVKRKKMSVSSADEEDTQFLNEIQMLSRCRHRHLVNLLGFCLEGAEQILVYEYAANGTLMDALFSTGQSPRQRPPQLMSWQGRLKILLGSALALQYLHHDVYRDRSLIHRDVKASNILLDDSYEALLADFGLTKAVEGAADGRGEETIIKGTPGYLDPEYFQRFEVTIKSDVYSYGVLMLVVLSGREAIARGTMPIVQHAKPFFDSQNAMGLLDSRLVGTPLCQHSVQNVANLARDCLAFEGDSRPLMKDVVRRLESALEQEEAFQRRNAQS